MARHDKSYFSRNYPLEVFFLFVPENINAATGLSCLSLQRLGAPSALYGHHSSRYGVYSHVCKDKIKHVLRLCQV